MKFYLVRKPAGNLSSCWHAFHSDNFVDAIQCTKLPQLVKLLPHAVVRVVHVVCHTIPGHHLQQLVRQVAHVAAVFGDGLKHPQNSADLGTASHQARGHSTR